MTTQPPDPAQPDPQPDLRPQPQPDPQSVRREHFALPALGLVVETSCRYLEELRFPETITAGLGLERLGTSSIVYRLALFGAGSQTPAALGRFVHVYVDRVTRRPVPVPPQIRTAVWALQV